VSQNNDLLYVFTGLSSDQVMAALQTALGKRDELQSVWLEKIARHPIESLSSFLLSTSAAFYLAERGVNPKINTFVDAVYYISTCLSVGYADIFAQTQTGKLIATLVMTLGPALTARVFDQPNPPAEPGQAEVIARLEAILEELRRRPVVT
jgi:hypothetical protein